MPGLRFTNRAEFATSSVLGWNGFQFCTWMRGRRHALRILFHEGFARREIETIRATQHL